MASLIQRANGTWYGVFSYQGKRVWRSTYSKSFDEAKKAVEVMEKDYVNWKNVTVLKFREQLSAILQGQLQDSTIDLFNQALSKLAELVGNKLLRAVSAYDVEIFKSKRLKEVSPPKVGIDFRMLKAAFNRAVQFGIIQKNPFVQVKNVQIPEREPLYLTPEDFDQLLSVITDHQLKAIVIFAVCTSMRIGEIVNVHWQDVDIKNTVVHLKNRPDFILKGKRQRRVPLNLTALSLLSTLERKSEFVFCNRKGERLTGRWVSRRFKRCARKAGLPEGIHLHSLRHSGASWLVQSNVPLGYVQRILGHSSITTTQIYAHSTPEHLRESVSRLDALFGSKIQPGPAALPGHYEPGGGNVLAVSLAAANQGEKRGAE
jgi:integrase